MKSLSYHLPRLCTENGPLEEKFHEKGKVSPRVATVKDPGKRHGGHRFNGQNSQIGRIKRFVASKVVCKEWRRYKITVHHLSRIISND